MDQATKREFKNSVYDVFAGIAKALGNGRRLELIDLLCQAERGVEELAYESEMSTANASQHLHVLRHAGLVKSRRVGTRVLYSLSSDSVFELWRSIRDFGEVRIADVENTLDAYLENRDELEAIGPEELRARMKDAAVVLLDVRPAKEYAAGHIPGAASVPIDELERHIDALPRDKEIVAYCRGRYCVYADEAVALLRRRGLRARRLEISVRDWLSVQ